LKARKEIARTSEGAIGDRPADPSNRASARFGLTGSDNVDDSPTGADEPHGDPAEYETAEDMPEELLQDEMEAFIAEFLAESNRAGNSGDTSTARSMAEDECTVCHDELNNIDADYADGNRWVGGEFNDTFELDIGVVTEDRVESLDLVGEINERTDRTAVGVEGRDALVRDDD
jgi:hypothetical protein